MDFGLQKSKSWPQGQGLGFRDFKEKGFRAKGSGFKSFRHWV